jgi:hypothetical protein
MEKRMNIYMSYNQEGFTEAKRVSDQQEFSLDELPEMISYLVSCGGYDFLKGHCESYQIYNQDGVIILDSNNAQSSEEVA